MEVLPALALLLSVFYLDSGLKALHLDRSSRLNRLVFVMDIVLALWAIDAVFAYRSPFPALSRAWFFLFSPTWNLFFALSLHFCLLASDRRRRLSPLSLAAIYAPALFFTLAADLGEIGGYLIHDEGLGPYLFPKALHLTFMVYYFGYLLIGLAVLGGKWLRSERGLEKRRLRIVFWTLAVPFFLAFLTDNASPALGYRLPNLSVFWSAIWAFGVRLAVFRYGFIAPFRNVADAGKLFSAFLDKSRDGIFLADSDGRIAIWNRAMEEITGASAAEVADKTLWEVQAGFGIEEAGARPDVEKIKRLVLEGLVGGRAAWDSRLSEYPILDKSGKVRWLQSAAFVINLGGKRTAAAAIVRDVSSERFAAAAAAEERRRLEKAEKMEAVGTLAAGLAHDFNNILTGIKGTVSLLRLDAAEGDFAARTEVEERLEIIDSSASRGGDLVRQLLALAKRSPSEPRVVFLAEAVSNAVKLTKNGLDPGVSIEVSPIWGDAAVLAEGIPGRARPHQPHPQRRRFDDDHEGPG